MFRQREKKNTVLLKVMRNIYCFIFLKRLKEKNYFEDQEHIRINFHRGGKAGLEINARKLAKCE